MGYAWIALARGAPRLMRRSRRPKPSGATAANAFQFFLAKRVFSTSDRGTVCVFSNQAYAANWAATLRAFIGYSSSSKIGTTKQRMGAAAQVCGLLQIPGRSRESRHF